MAQCRTVLTRREQEVLSLLAQRLTDPEIVDSLSISTRTAKTHVANILGKLGAANRREAVRIAAWLGIAVRPVLLRSADR
jgi:DNA-binding CsgD family transcriptional regulator